MKNKNITPPLRSIEEELAACRKAWKPYQSKAKWSNKLVWCCHHEFRIEMLTFSARDRIAHLLTYKDHNEQAARFRSFRPVKRHPLITKAMREIEEKRKLGFEHASIIIKLRRSPRLAAIHDKQYPNHAWRNGRVFGT